MTLTAQGALDIPIGYPYITRGSEFLYQREVTICSHLTAGAIFNFFNTALRKIVLGFMELNSAFIIWSLHFSLGEQTIPMEDFMITVDGKPI